MKSTKITLTLGLNKFELRNIEVYERLSEETTAFACNIYINNILVGGCTNSGKGEGNFPSIYGRDKEETILYRELYGVIEAEVVKHKCHFTDPYTHKNYVWDYSMDFLIATMVESAWYYGEKEFSFDNE